MAINASDGLGERLAKYRRLSGLSAQKLADLAGFGLTRGVIANIESGRKKDITVDQLLALSASLGIPPVALALPLEQPQRWVHLHGDDYGSRGAIYNRVYHLVDWFNGARDTKVMPDSHVGDTRIAYALIYAIKEYEMARYLVDRVKAPNAKRSKKMTYEEELQIAQENLEEAAQRLRDLGADPRNWKIDE